MEPRGFGWVKKADIPKGHESIPLNKVYMPAAGGTGNDTQVIGKPFVGDANSVCSFTYIIIGYDPVKHNFSHDECVSIVSYMNTRFFRYLVSIKKKTQHTSRDVFQFVPIQDWRKLWTDEELYVKYGLTSDEINYIEAKVKPMESDALFNAEELLDPEFGNFDLLEYGVKIGDRIVYTPTGTEVTVAENNMVEVGGDLYTLAQFTAKFMPRNKRSVSGVCQGPRYFSYNGVSLYKLKESFLGGKKTK